MILEYLQWDSDFFGLKIGRIVGDEKFAEKSLAILLNQAKIANYALLYIFLPEDYVINDVFLSKNKGNLVDKKNVYRKKLYKGSIILSDEIQDYTGKRLSTDLLNLTYLSGQFSRFNTDKNLPNDAFGRLYKTWIEKSLNGEIANKVFVSIKNNKIVGFATLKITDKIGEIGLIAVSETMQGQRIGSKLLDRCADFSKENGINILEVPTQSHNVSACKFYEKYGFEKFSTTNIYHFWI